MPDITPDEFIAKWSVSSLKERSAAQEHFCDLCRLLDETTPAQADPDGSWYCFERGDQPNDLFNLPEGTRVMDMSKMPDAMQGGPMGGIMRQ